mmetsp:Transcript_26598/g.47937  ORF Transcript_26598/g.47937 Transcript_26598/m.47937 type:complete len:146 (-) Transcript_26598:111-548(-)
MPGPPKCTLVGAPIALLLPPPRWKEPAWAPRLTTVSPAPPAPLLLERLDLSWDWDLPLRLLQDLDALFVPVNLLLLFVRVDLPLFSKQREDAVNKFEINEFLFFSDREKWLPAFSFVATHHQTDQYQTSNCEFIYNHSIDDGLQH